MANKIGICGHCNVGKTTVGREVALRLGYDFISIGEYCEKNNVLDKVSSEWGLHDYVHRFVGDLIRDPADMVIDGRTVHMSYKDPKFINDCVSFIVLLKANLDIRVERYLLRNPGKTTKWAIESISKRTENIKRVLHDYYKTDVFDETLFDFHIQTDGLEIIDVADIIIHEAQEAYNGIERTTGKD